METQIGWRIIVTVTGTIPGAHISLAGAGDNYRTMIVGRNAENANNTTSDCLDLLCALNTSVGGSFIARTYTGVGNSIVFGRHGDGVKGSTSALIGSTTYPNPENNASYLSPVWITETSSFLRGRMRGFYHFLHALGSVNNGDTFGGVGPPYVGRSFMFIKQSGNLGIYVIEISNTLETN